ncbi:MAG: hypothetical protein L6U16_03200 [Porphyromonadaceae bacterium]|nr:MAG: hypothetical protein L6U16_03200 [Porphyromonadaceae bacterium]
MMRQCDHWADDDTNFSQPKPVMYDDGNEGLFSIAPPKQTGSRPPHPLPITLQHTNLGDRAGAHTDPTHGFFVGGKSHGGSTHL